MDIWHITLCSEICFVSSITSILCLGPSHMWAQIDDQGESAINILFCEGRAKCGGESTCQGMGGNLHIILCWGWGVYIEVLYSRWLPFTLNEWSLLMHWCLKPRHAPQSNVSFVNVFRDYVILRIRSLSFLMSVFAGHFVSCVHISRVTRSGQLFIHYVRHTAWSSLP